MKTLVLVPGLEKTSDSFRRRLVEIADAHNWDADAINAVISFETAGTFAPDAGWRAWKPQRTATGLIQFLEATAKSLGVPPISHSPHTELQELGRGQAWATWALMSMSAEEQLSLVEKHLERAFKMQPPARPVDYYLAVFAPAFVGKPLDQVMFRAGTPEYEQNKALDKNGRGSIIVDDMRRVIEGRLEQAHGEVIMVEGNQPNWIGPVLVAGTILGLAGYALLQFARGKDAELSAAKKWVS